jgi:hypothetical protein
MPVSLRTANANTVATRLGCGMCVANGDALLYAVVVDSLLKILAFSKKKVVPHLFAM